MSLVNPEFPEEQIVHVRVERKPPFQHIQIIRDSAKYHICLGYLIPIPDDSFAVFQVFLGFSKVERREIDRA